MNDWISVKERLPEKDGWYFVYAPEYWGNNKIYPMRRKTPCFSYGECQGLDCHPLDATS